MVKSNHFSISWQTSNVNDNLLPQLQWELEQYDLFVVTGRGVTGGDVNYDAVNKNKCLKVGRELSQQRRDAV